MRAALQWIGAGIAMLVVSAVGLYGLSRWLGPTDAQERALALMNQPRPLPGNNAFAALWLLPYDVPAGAVEAVAAQDVRAFAARSAPGRRIAGTGTGTGTAEAFVSSAAQRLEKFADNGKPVLCKPDKPGCLDQVRAQLPAYAQWRDGHRALI